MARGSSTSRWSRISGSMCLRIAGGESQRKSVFDAESQKRRGSVKHVLCVFCVSASKNRSSARGLLDGKQDPMTGKAGAERRHPPVPAGRVLGQRCLQHEIHTRAADVAVVAEDCRAPARLIFGKAEPLADGRKY